MRKIVSNSLSHLFSLSGFDSSQIVSLIVKYGIETSEKEEYRQLRAEIFLAFTIRLPLSVDKIFKTTNYSDIERSLREIVLPNITAVLDGKQRQILIDVLMNQPTTIGDIAKRLSVSESTISRQVARLAELGALHLVQKGKTKEVRITLTGKILL